MKKWLIASAICMIPIFFLGVCNPLIVVMMKSKTHDLSGINAAIFLWYIGGLGLCISVVLTTTISMVRRSDIIDRLDKKEEELDKEWTRIQSIRRKYEKLIADETSRTD